MKPVLFALALAAGLMGADSPSDVDRVVAGKLAPDFRLKDGDAKEHTLSARRGERVVVVFYRGYW